MRIIDADELIKLLKKQILISDGEYEVGFNYGIDTAIQFISQMPTAIEKNKFEVYLKGEDIDEPR